MVDLFQGFPARLGALTQGRKWLFPQVATDFFPLEQHVLVLALAGADS